MRGVNVLQHPYTFLLSLSHIYIYTAVVQRQPKAGGRSDMAYPQSAGIIFDPADSQTQHSGARSVQPCWCVLRLRWPLGRSPHNRDVYGQYDCCNCDSPSLYLELGFSLYTLHFLLFLPCFRMQARCGRDRGWPPKAKTQTFGNKHSR